MSWYLKTPGGGGSGGSSTLIDLTDVDVAAAFPGRFLMKDAPVRDGGTGKWIDSSPFYYLNNYYLYAGQTSLVIMDDKITEFGDQQEWYEMYKVYTDVKGVVPYDVSISNHTMTLKFVPQSVNVKVVVRLYMTSPYLLN